MGMLVSPYRHAVAGGGSSPTIRGYRLTTTAGGGIIDWYWPTGSVVGDRAAVLIGHGWHVSSTPGGWTQLEYLSGSFWNFSIYTKLLDSTDIANGFGRFFFGGSSHGAIGGVTFVGATGGIRDSVASRNGSGATSRSVSTDGTPQAGDYVLALGSARVTGTATCDLATQLAAQNTGEGCFTLNGGVLVSGGTKTANFTYPGGSAGDGQGIVVVQP